MTSERLLPKGPYTLWVDYGYDGWKWTDYDSLTAAMLADKYGSSWVINQPLTGSEMWEAALNEIHQRELVKRETGSLIIPTPPASDTA